MPITARSLGVAIFLPSSICEEGPVLQANLATIQPDLLRAFDGPALLRSYRKGATVYRRGRAVRGLFLLQKGRVKLSLGDTPTAFSLHVAGPGSVLALGETMAGSPYEATAETLETCQVVFVRREDFLNYLREHRELCLQIVQQLSEDLHLLYQRYRTVGGPPTRVRRSKSGPPVAIDKARLPSGDRLP